MCEIHSDADWDLCDMNCPRDEDEEDAEVIRVAVGA